MIAPRTIRPLITVAAIVSLAVAAETQTKARSGSNPPASPSGRTTAGKILPDPLLLDGSAQAAEKKSEYGMLGDFELPGDENAQTNRVGGPSNPNGKPGGNAGLEISIQGPPIGLGGLAQPSGKGSGIGGLPPIAPAAGVGGAAGTESGQMGGIGQTGGAAGAGGQAAGGQAPAGQTGGALGNVGGQNGGSPLGAGQPGGQAGGIQVGELGGEGAAGMAADGMGGKPPPITIGDKAMRIDTSANPPTTVGAKPQIVDGHVQQHKATGTGGIAPTSPQGPGRIEKGSTIPAGL